MKVAEGDLDACIWYCGDVWDHAAPSLIVEEAGGRFSDHKGVNDSTAEKHFIQMASCTIKSWPR